MADQTCSYVDNRMVSVTFSTGIERKKCPLLIISCLDQGSSNKIPDMKSSICLPPQESNRQSRQRIIAKYFRRSIWKGSRQILSYLYLYLISLSKLAKHTVLFFSYKTYIVDKDGAFSFLFSDLFLGFTYCIWPQWHWTISRCHVFLPRREKYGSFLVFYFQYFVTFVSFKLTPHHKVFFVNVYVVFVEIEYEKISVIGQEICMPASLFVSAVSSRSYLKVYLHFSIFPMLPLSILTVHENIVSCISLTLSLSLCLFPPICPFPSGVII
jgi:hypothetical protein